MRNRTIPAVFLVIFLTGCATSQSQVEGDVSRATEDAISDVSDAWSMAGREGVVPLGWVASFDDPKLTDLVKEAQANNLDLAAAAANVAQAQALARQAGASLVPNADLSAGSSRGGQLDSGAAGPTTSLNAGVQVGWEVDLWGRIRSGAAQAAASAQAAEADFRFAQHSIAANTAITYFTAIEAQQQLTIAEESLGLVEETVRIVQAQYDEGVGSGQDIALARSDLAAAKDQVAALEGASRDALRALELLLGRYPGAEIEVQNTLPDVPAEPPAGVPSEVLERRPDVVSAERQVAAAFNATNQAKAARLPTLSLTASIGGASNELSSLLDPANVAWSAGTSLLAPLFDGGVRRENVNIATAQQDAALARYARAALQAFSDVESALDQGDVLANRNDALQEASDQAAEAFRIAELRYKEGETSLIDLLTIQQRAIGTRSSLASVRRLLLQQRVNLNLALGGSWE